MQTQDIVGFKLSPQQRHAWKLRDKMQQGAAGQIVCEVEIHGSVQADRLRSSVDAVVQRYEILRTRFPHLGGMSIPLQVIEENADFAWSAPLIGATETEFAEATVLTREQAKQWNPSLEDGPIFGAWFVAGSTEKNKFWLSVPVICVDRISAEQLIREISSVYAGTFQASDDTMQYADLARWLNEIAEGPEAGRGQEYWRQLVAETSNLQLPWHGTSDGDRDFVTLHKQLDQAQTAEIAKLARNLGVNEETILLGCWQALLARLGEAQDFAIAVSLSGRSYEGTEEAIGPLERRVPLACKTDGTKKVWELIRATAEQLSESGEWQEYFTPDTLKEQFFTDYGFQYSKQAAWQEASGSRWQIVRISEHDEGQKVFLEAIQKEEGIELSLHFDQNAVSPVAALRMLQQLTNLVQSVASSNENTTLQKLELVGQEEAGVLFGTFNKTRESYELDRTVVSLFEEQARLHPENVALVAGTEQLTYAELDRQANQLARHLLAIGVEQEQVVGICLERSTSLITTLLAIWKAGGAYLPLDAEYPQERLNYMLSDSAVRCIITESEHAGAMQSLGVPVTVLDKEWPRIKTQSAEDISAKAADANLAYVIYTSGSTGRPKGVMVAHRSLTNHMQWAIQTHGLGERERVLQKTNISFDASVWEWLFPVLQGGTLVIAEPGMHTDSRYIVQQIQKEKITTLQVVPTMLRVILDEDNVGACTSLERIFAGGEALHPDVVQRFKEKIGKDLINLYGPTEATINAASIKMNDEQSVVIGRPIANTAIHILRDGVTLAGIGEVGEICIVGEALARGYIGRADETANKYTPNPCAKERGERLYRSGDKGRWREDGVLEYLGRMDDQVKVRGYRIELGEVERGVQQEAGSRQVAVAVKERRGSKDLQLVAYVECGSENGSAEILDAIREGVKKRLPEYMCPGVYVAVERLPWNKSGKVDRKALPEPESVASEEKGEYRAPSNEVEEKLAEIWAAVLGRGPVGVRSNFFELGGDSIVGIQIVARARQAGIELTPKQLFQHQTIEELARAAGAKGKRVEAEQGEIKGKARLTPIQEWYFQQTSDNRNHYNQAFLFEVGGEVRREWLEQALSKLIEQHDALRLRFDREGNRWVQRYAAVVESALQIDHVDLRGFIIRAEQDRELKKFVEQQHQKLDIDHGPVVRAAWIDLGRERGRRLLVVAHHLVIDGVSWRILLEDVEQWYGQLAAGKELKELKSPAKTTSYKQWAEELEKYAGSPGAEAEGRYWEEQEKVEVESLYEDDPTGANLVSDEGRVVRVLDEEQTSQLLREASQAYNTQVMDLLLSAMVGGLKGWQGHEHIRVEMEGHGREEVMGGVDLTRTVGWFTSVYPVVLEWKAGEGIGERIKRIKEQLRTIPQRGIGYGVLRYLGGKKWSEKLAGSSELLVNYLGQFDQSMGKGALLQAAKEGSGRALSAGTERSSKIDLNALVVGGRLQMMWSYSQKRYRRQTVEALAEAYETSLLEIIQHCLKSNPSGISSEQFANFKWQDSQLGDIAAAIQKVQ